jgi:hypothetical protein
MPPRYASPDQLAALQIAPPGGRRGKPLHRRLVPAEVGDRVTTAKIAVYVANLASPREPRLLATSTFAARPIGIVNVVAVRVHDDPRTTASRALVT